MEKVLIIDDFEPVRKVIKRIVEREKFIALQASDGKEGLDVFERERPEIVITDLKMPNIDGKGVLCAIKSQHPETEVIVLTGYGDTETSNFLIKNGAFSYLKKPLDLHQLVKILSEARKKVNKGAVSPDSNTPHPNTSEDVCLRFTAQGDIRVDWEGDARKSAREFIRNGTHHLALPLIVIDRGLNVLFSNQAFSKLAGGEPDYLKAESIRALKSNGIKLADEHSFIHTISKALDGNRLSADLESLGDVIVFKIDQIINAEAEPLFVLCFPTTVS